MSNRVDNNREAQRSEQKRIEKQAMKDSRKGSDEFAKLVGQKQENTSKANQSKERTKGEMLKQTLAQKSMKGSNALMARQGIQANKFQQALQKQGTDNLQQTKSESTHRNDESQEVRHFNDQQDQVRERKEMDRNERVQGLRDDDAQSGSGSGGGFGGGANEGGQQHEQGQQSALAGTSAIDAAGAPTAQAAAQAAASAPQIPPHVIKEIVERVFVGVNTEGLNEFTIDLKGMMLEGTTLQISADGAKIFAKVTTNDKNVGRLFKASEGELARVFGRKGLRLESMSIEER
jgi:hypothetical protein